MTLFYLHGINANGTFLSELTDATPGLNSDNMVAYAAGHPFPLFTAVRGQLPSVPFTSTSVKQILDLVLGLPPVDSIYCGNTSAGNTDLYYKKGLDLGVRVPDATAEHYRFRMAAAFFYWNTITATLQQDATIACQVAATYDGINEPIVPVGNVALAGTPLADEYYSMGPVYLNGNLVGDEQDWTLSSGIALETAGGGSDAGGALWPTFTGVRAFAQTVTFTNLGSPWGDITALAGTAISSLVLYLRKKAQDGTHVSNASAAHIKITATNGLILPETTTGGINNPASSALTAMLRAPDSSSDVLAIDTASTIPI